MIAEMRPVIDLLEFYFREARSHIEGLSTEEINWKPLQGETADESVNSLYGLAVHISLVAMNIAAKISGTQPPELSETENGNAGIQTTGIGPDRAIELLNMAQLAATDCIASLTEAQLEEMRERRYGSWVAEPKSVRWLVLHILDHTALHVGHMELTHQLLKVSTSSPEA